MRLKEQFRKETALFILEAPPLCTRSPGRKKVSLAGKNEVIRIPCTGETSPASPENALNTPVCRESVFPAGLFQKNLSGAEKDEQKRKTTKTLRCTLLMVTSGKRWGRETTGTPFPAESIQTGKRGKGKETPARTRKPERLKRKATQPARPEVNGKAV